MTRAGNEALWSLGMVGKKRRSGTVTTVLGPFDPGALGIVDAHSHVWVEAVPDAPAPSPSLADREPILAELREFRRAGGGAIVDCQPGGCGRDGNILAELSAASGVALVACTGFHRRRYYSPDAPLWRMKASAAADAFIAELRQGLVETRERPLPVRAGFVKAACEATLADTPRAPLEGAAWAARVTGAALAVHTERGEAAEELVRFLATEEVDAHQLILCHMDKRPDFELHRELAQAGVLLEYDTFHRPKYDPEANLWPLIERMAAAGLDGAVALATDSADPTLWAYGGGPGPASLPGSIRVRLQALGLRPETVTGMLGQNVAARLAGLAETLSQQETER
jgi:predicted metal-dependent phosphotriesterase family hydrolase